MSEQDEWRELDALADKHEAAEQAEQAEQAAHDAPAPQATEPSNEAAELAAFAVGAINSALTLIESRLELAEQTEAAREECAPFIEKHQLHQSNGAGAALRWWPEMRLGLFLGKYLKTIVSQWRALKASDETDETDHTEHKETATDGKKRKHTTTEPARAVLSPDGIRQKPDPKAAGRNPFDWMPVN